MTRSSLAAKVVVLGSVTYTSAMSISVDGA